MQVAISMTDLIKARFKGSHPKTLFLQDVIYLLQSRPITSFQAWTDYELTHEFDSAMSSRYDITTKANVGCVTVNEMAGGREVQNLAKIDK